MMTDKAPGRIWATINGAGTSLPSGLRYLLGGWREQEHSGAVEYVRADLVPPGWQPIETAPKDETFILGWGDPDNQFALVQLSWEWGEMWWEVEPNFAWRDFAGVPYEPTHWMPIPEPPKE